MDKTFLEQRIEEKAKRKFEETLKDLRRGIQQNEIGSRLVVDDIPLKDHPAIERLPDFEEVKKEVIEKFIEEETNNILSSLTDLEYLLQTRKA